MMDGPEIEEIRQAILDAYDENGLEQMLRFRLNVRLAQITGNHEFSHRVFQVVEWADRSSRMTELIEAAYYHNSTNKNVRNIHKQYCASPSAAETSASPDEPVELVITGDHGRTVFWLAPVQPADIGGLWDSAPPFRRVIFALDFDESDALCRVLLRLLCHHAPGGLDIAVRDNRTWMNALTEAQIPYLPVDARHGVGTGWQDCSGSPSTSGRHWSRDGLAAALEDGLDDWCLRRLDLVVRDALRSGSGYTGDFRQIHQDLRRLMLQRWREWFQTLSEDREKDTPEAWARKKAVRHRFKRMLLSVTDGAVGDWGGFALGPATMESCMLPATLLALAVAVCLDQPWQPHERTPGNLSSSMFNGHACGVERVNGDCLEDFLDRKTSFPWNSHIVLLAKSRYSFATIAPRLQSLGASGGHPPT